MYKIVVVDDESLVLKSLKACIDWNECGFELIGEANEGDKAYDLILALQPDVVITDIRMPGMNGLELIQKANEAGFKGHFIVISGFAEFDYVQKAIKHGVLGYCLKPFDKVEIAEMLMKAKVILKERQTLDEMELLINFSG